MSPPVLFRHNKRISLFVTLCFLGLTPLQAVRKTRLTWVNGVGYNLQHMDEGKVEISSRFGGKPVEYCHNPTSMTHEDDMVGYLGDLTQASTQKLGRITAEVNELVRHLKDAVASVGRRGRVIHIAHSQGALLTYLATRQLSPLEMNQIEVLAFGGAAALRKTAETPFYRCVNYYSVNDPLLWLVPSAVQALRSGFVGDEFCFLAPREGDPISDHGLLGKTYGKALAWEGQRFQRKYQTLVYRVSHSIVLMLTLLLQAVSANVFGFAKELWRQICVPVLRCVLAVLLWLKSMSENVLMHIETGVLRPLRVITSATLEMILLLYKGNERYEPVNKPRKQAA